MDETKQLTNEEEQALRNDARDFPLSARANGVPRLLATLDAERAKVADMLVALERLTLLLSAIRPGMTLQNETHWVCLEEAHNAGCAAVTKARSP